MYLPQQDTRLSDKAAVVLTTPEGEEFPKGTAFIYGEKRCYPVNGQGIFDSGPGAGSYGYHGYN